MSSLLSSSSLMMKMDSNRIILLKLFISGLLSYIFAIIYQLCLANNKSILLKHFFNISIGLSICLFNFGIDTIHSLITCFTIYCSIRLLGPTRLMVILNFVFCMSYLLYGYYDKYQNNLHDVLTWTMPQCVLTLSLIALSFDIYDGQQNLKSKENPNRNNDKKIIITNEDTAIERIPTIIEILSKCYFPPIFLIGPQIKFKDYIIFIESNESILKSCWKPSILRFLSGMIYLSIFQIGSIYWPTKYLLSDDFKSYGLFAKLTIIAITNKITLCKYISGWLISEGACIMYGIAQNPLNPHQHDRCSNVSIFHFETTATFRGIIESFNITTNQFAMKYIFKRLKFLGSKMLSQLMTLFFLALWHGFSIGYYNTFALEFLIVKMETDIANKVIEYRTGNNGFNQLLNNISIRWLLYLLMRIHVIYMLSYSLISFTILDFFKWTSTLSEIYYLGHIIYFGWFILSIPFNLLSSSNSSHKISNQQKNK
ncbi:lysophospholipid acyltransferase 5-like [Dermatophagoides pteronyssinus]|uniref:lysophospholipid acyltransferase 5-like n=1 Tax=Dermatophagoides pteronyssinus TaxID=6956 RepID=UPI003F671D04